MIVQPSQNVHLSVGFHKGWGALHPPYLTIVSAGLFSLESVTAPCIGP